MKKIKDLYQKSASTKDVINKFKWAFIAYEFLSLLLYLILILDSSLSNSPPSGFGIIILLLLITGIVLLVRLVKAAKKLKDVGVIEVGSGLLICLQMLNCYGPTSIIIPLYILIQSKEKSVEEKQAPLPKSLEKLSKVPFGVFFLGCFYIVGLIFYLNSYVYIPFNTKVYPYSAILLDSIFYFILTFLGVIGGIYILMLRNWARKLILVLGIAGIIWPMTYALPSTNVEGISRGQERSNMYRSAGKRQILSSTEYNDEQRNEMLRSNNMINDWMDKYLTLGLVLFSSLWFAIIYYYFTRPKVKEQFT